MIRQIFSPYPIDTPDLSIHGVGIQEVMPPCIVNRPGGTGDYLFMFFYDPVFCGIPDDYAGVPANSLIIWDPRHGHYYGNPSVDWNHSWIHCDGRWIGEILAESGIPLNIPFPQPSSEVIERYLLAIYQELALFPVPDAVIVRNALHSWVREISRALAETNGKPAVPEAFVEARQYIIEHFHEHITLQELSEITHLSVPHFCNRFKQYFGVPAIEYLIQLRMQHAVYLLRDRGLSITEIACRVGYQDLYQFSKLFKKYHQICPRLKRQGL